jgi:hypothetical protein
VRLVASITGNAAQMAEGVASGWSQ